MNLHPVILLIIIANVLVSFKGFKDYRFFERYKFQVGAVLRGEHIRNLTSGFLHVDTTHLFFNMLTLYFFAPWALIGVLNNTYKFLAIYLVSLLLGSFLSLFMHKKEPYYSAVGASGAVTGIVYAAITFFPEMTVYYKIPGVVFGVGYLLYSIYGMKKRVGNIGHSAHFGGAVGGYAMALLFRPDLFERHPIHLALLALPIVVLFVLEKMGKLN